MFWQCAKSVCLLGLVVCAGCSSIGASANFKLPSRLRKSQSAISEKRKPDPRDAESADLPQRRPLIARHSKPGSKGTQLSDAQRRKDSEVNDVSDAKRADQRNGLAKVEPLAAPDSLKLRPLRDEQSNVTLASAESNSQSDSSDVSPAGHSVDASNQIELSVRDGREITTPEETRSRQTERSGISNSSGAASPDKNETSREWTGKLKSLTEWDRNPLNFRREDERDSAENKGLRRPKQLPKLIANPFRNHDNKEKATDTELHAKDVDSQGEHPSIKTAQIVPANSLRITPGAELWEEELDKLVSLMEAEASATGVASSGTLSRDELRQQVALRMLYIINDQPQLAMQPIPGLHSVDQEFWTSLFWGLSNYLNEKGLDPTERSTKTIEQLRSATHYLQITAKLQLRNVSFCSQINGFGSFDQFETDVFSPGQPVLIYCDVRNFQSEASAEGFFVTKLRSTIEIYEGNQTGQLVDRNSFPATEDLCRSIRTDYYNSYRIDLPSHLNSGPHLLRLTVYDELSGKSATETMPFTVQ